MLGYFHMCFSVSKYKLESLKVQDNIFYLLTYTLPPFHFQPSFCFEGGSFSNYIANQFLVKELYLPTQQTFIEYVLP